LIVVGNARLDNSRYVKSTYRDRLDQGILTIYNIGTDIECAGRQNGSDGVPVSYASDDGTLWHVEPPGTSQATALTAGLIAYLLTDPQLVPLFNVGGKKDIVSPVKSPKNDYASIISMNLLIVLNHRQDWSNPIFAILEQG